jgi:hypothetical protein
MNHPFRDETQSTLRRYLQKPEDPITMPNQLMAAMTSLPRKGLCSAAQGCPAQPGNPGSARKNEIQPCKGCASNQPKLAASTEPLQGSRSDLSISQGSPTCVGQPWSALRNAFSVEIAHGRSSVTARCADIDGRITARTERDCRIAHFNRKT